MTSTDKVFAGGIPAIYENFMVPMIFEPYAVEMAKRLAALRPRDVLEVAAGTGVLTRAMAATLGPGMHITATDLNQPMLDIAIAKQSAGGTITWKQADGLALPFEDQSFDAVACQFGVMFFPDKVQGYREAHRVLRLGGAYIFAVWDRLESNDFVTTVSKALADRFPDDPPRFMSRGPHGYHDLKVIRSELEAAGFASVNAETVEQVSTASSALHAATGYCQGNPLGAEIEARAPGKLQEVTEGVAEALEKRFGHGAIQGKISAHIITSIR
jgi:ubiquinone/menaquinone biosynthesis C-methylase UbiE